MADAQEQVKLAVLASYNDKGNLDIDELNKNLANIEGLTYKGEKVGADNKIEKLADIVNVDGYDILIQDDGTADLVSKDVTTANKETPNEPVILSGMTKIMFTEPTEEEIGRTVKDGEEGFKEDSWYNYTEKRWANVETADGSMWVWIPRYAYKVNEADHTFDIKFLIGTTDYYYDENGELQEAERITSKEDTADTKNKYYTHPAFTDESDEKIEYANGGWDKELKGIWVAKFEAGFAGGNISKFKEGATSEDTVAKETNLTYSQFNTWVGATEKGASSDGEDAVRNWLDGIYSVRTGSNYEWKNGKETKIKYPIFMGTTYSMNYINNNDIFLISKEISASGNPYKLPTTADSHLIKDSEWGAVAYLGQSKYGLEEKEVCINNVTLDSGGKERTSTDGKSGVDSVYAVTGLTSKAVVERISEVQNNVGKNAEEVISQINNISGNSPTAIGEIYTWNQKSGQGASSSGTIYGIYDLSGGLRDKTSAYVADGSQCLTSFGKSLLYNESTTEEKSTKYVTVYAHDPEYDKGQDTAIQKNYEMAANKRKFGNARHETSTNGNGSTSWKNDSSYFEYFWYPFSGRGLGWNISASAGLFGFSFDNGGNTFGSGFHVVLVGM